MDAGKAWERLATGNREYVERGAYAGDVSAAARVATADGQSPYAIVVACSDSRVIPEAIFGVGIGELFVVRVAGNVVGPHELGSIEYAAGHLGSRLVVVLGHTHCGAVGAAIAGGADGHTACLTDAIREAIGDERDQRAAAAINAQTGARAVKQALPELSLDVRAAVYDIHTGMVDWLGA